MLSKVRGLRVVSRTSSFYFKGKDADLPTIARKLNAATILEGSVRKSGNRVRITTQLVRVASDTHLWSEIYDRELGDIFAVQSDIAESVVKELRAALIGQPVIAASRAAATDVREAAIGRSGSPEAFQLYLQGKFFGERTTQADTDMAIELFQKALEIDPNFALAWTGLSFSHQVQAAYGFAPVGIGFERARKAAQHALRLVPDLAEGHIELGHVLESHDWNWSAADKSFRRALELAPGYIHGLHAAAGLARVVGQLDAAVELIGKAVAIDPLSARAHRHAGLVYVAADRLEDAAAAFQLALELGPNLGLSHACLAIVRVLQGRGHEGMALAEFESYAVFRNLAFAMIHHALGHSTESDTALRALINGSGSNAAYQIAEVYAYRNEVEKAFEWLERAYAQREPAIAFCATERLLCPLHIDPRWLPFVRRLGLA